MNAQSFMVFYFFDHQIYFPGRKKYHKNKLQLKLGC